MPLDQLGFGQVQRRCRRWQAQAPECEVRRGRLEEGQPLVAAGVPSGLGRGQLHAGLFAQQLRATGPHGGLGTAQAQVQLAFAVFCLPAAGVERQRLAAPALQAIKRLRLRQLEAQRGVGGRHGQHLERHLGDQTERAECAHHQARDVVAGHVFHHLATKLQPLALAIDEVHAQHIVAQAAHAGARRSAQPAGDHAADAGIGAARPGQARRLKGQVLALRRQRGLDLGQWRTGSGSKHQLARFVTQDAAQRRRRQHLAVQPLAVKILAAQAPDTQRLARLGGGAHAFGQALRGVFQVHGLQSAKKLTGRPGTSTRQESTQPDCGHCARSAALRPWLTLVR